MHHDRAAHPPPPPRAIHDRPSQPRTSTEVRNGSASAAQGSRHFAGPADLLFGRPDVAALLRDTGSRAAAVGETRVAVCVCGPRGAPCYARAAAAPVRVPTCARHCAGGGLSAPRTCVTVRVVLAASGLQT